MGNPGVGFLPMHLAEQKIVRDILLGVQ